MFTYVASPSPRGNATIRRVCQNSRCRGTMYVKSDASGYRCPHCNQKQSS